MTDVNRAITPEILTIPDLFNATVNANAVRWVLDYIGELAASVARCEARNVTACSVCVERGRIAEDIGALLPEVKS